MRTRLRVAVVLALSIVLDCLGAPPATATFTVEAVDSFGTVGARSSIVLDTLGNPHIGYYAETNGDLKYAVRSFGAWAIEAADTTDDVGHFMALALDSSDRPHMSYHDEATNALKYCTKSGGIWSTELVDVPLAGGDVGWWTSIAVDSGGNPRIAYFSAEAARLRFASKISGAWTIEDVGDQGPLFAYHISLQMDRSDRPHISFWDLDGETINYCMRSGAGVWAIETVVGTAHVGNSTSIALDANEAPHIAYYHSTGATTGFLGYAKRVSGTWLAEGVDTSSQATGFYASLELNPADEARISYFDNSNGDLRCAATYSGVWVMATLDSVGTVGATTSLALWPDETMHVSYFDISQLDLKYATGRVGTAVEGVVSQRLTLTIVPNPSGKETLLRYTLPEDGRIQLTIYDVAGRRVRRFEKRGAFGEVGWDGRDESSRLTGPGTYFVRMESGSGGSMRRFTRLR